MLLKNQKANLFPLNIIKSTALIPDAIDFSLTFRLDQTGKSMLSGTGFFLRKIII
jgi:hypothetical protein